MRKKLAVTLAEMLVALAIIGIISTFALVTIKPSDKAYKWLYVRIYHTLETAVYNSMLARAEFPTTTQNFCEMLLDYMNSDNVNCAAADLDNTASVFPDANVKIVLNNGMRIWIASNGGTFYTLNEVIGSNSVAMRYYLVFVDLNGDKAPNSAQWVSGGKMADIVAFAVTETSTVVPLGPPEIDTRYMLATAIYPPDDENKPEGTHSNPTSYLEAKSLAWGNSRSEAEPMSLNFRGTLPVDSPFYVTYPATAGVNTTAGCTSENNRVSPCYVKVENYN